MKVSKEIESLVPYKAGKPISETKREYGIDEVYKLASNENPIGSSPKAIKAIESALQNLNRYPDPSCYELLQAVSKHWQYPANLLAAGNGSNEIIDILIRIYCEPGDGILTSQAAFIAYDLCAQAARANRFHVSLRPDYSMDLNGMAEFFLSHPEKKIRIIFVPNPNNPTGSFVKDSEVSEFLKKVGNRDDVLVVFDEAYNEFVRSSDYSSAQKYFKQYNNIAVIRTMSKVYGLAGLRLGILLGNSQTVDYFHRVRNPFNVNELAQVAAIAALEDKEFITSTQKLTWTGLDYFYQELKKMGLPYIESQANFVMFDTLRNALDVNEKLLQRGIIMRPINNYGFATHLRLSVGLENENHLAMKVLSEVLKEVPAKG